MKITYHRATLADVDTLVRYRCMFLAEHPGFAADEVDDSLEDELRRYFLEAMPGGSFIAWLAKRGEEVVATSGMVVWKIPANNSVRNGKLGYILNMYTLPEARGQGICTALLERLIEEAKALSLARVHLHASKMGEPIYRKRGFRELSDVELALRLQR